MQKIDIQQQFENIPKPMFNKQNDSISAKNELSVDKNWKIFKELLKMKISQREFMMWYENFYLLKISNGIADFCCCQPYQREWILNNHSRLLKNILLEVTGQNLDICINLDESKKEKTKKKKYEYHNPGEDMPIFSDENNVEKQKEKSIKSSQLNTEYSFGNFIIGAGNRLAHAVSQAVAENPGKAYNPVFFYGRTGVGKTHLMQAIGNEIIQKNPSKKIMYCNSEEFLNAVINAIRTGSTENFRNNYRNLDVLIIDDIHFITSSPKTQEELFHTFNSLYLANKQIIMASDKLPKDIHGLTERLRSRFEGGMICDIQPPDYETRMAILIKKMNEYNIKIPVNILEMIALNIDSNIRELEGAITKIATTIKILGSEVSEEDIMQILSLDIESRRKKINPEKVVKVVSEVFEVNPREIKGKKRTAYIVKARQTIMYILRDSLEMPFEKIARYVNRKDHTTVLHACEKIQKLIENDKQFVEKLDKCKYMLSE